MADKSDGTEEHQQTDKERLEKRKALNKWQDVVRRIYPDLLSRTYCVPPVYFNRIAYEQKTVAGEPALVINAAGASPSSESTAEQPPTPQSQSQQQAQKSATSPEQASNTGQPCEASPPSPKPLALEELLQFWSKLPLFSSGGCNPSWPSSSQAAPSALCGAQGRVKDSDSPGKNPKVKSDASSEKTPAGQVNESAGKTSQCKSSKPSGKTTSSDTKSPEPAVPYGRASPEKTSTSSTTDSSRESTFSYSLWSEVPASGAKFRKYKHYESDTYEDFAQQHVLHCLQDLGQRQNEVMFVLSQLDYSNYLNKHDRFAAVRQFPRLVKDKRHGDSKQNVNHPLGNSAQIRGDFDVLVLHRHYGVLVGEIKSVGLNMAGLTKSQAEADRVVLDRLQKCVRQLNKSENVVKYIVSELAQDLLVKKTAMLPYVSAEQLKRVLNNPQLAEDLCKCLGAPDVESAVQLCLCADQMSDPKRPWDVASVTSELAAWWRRCMACTTDPNMSDGVYVKLVSMLAGPATTVSVHCVVPPRVEVRTEGEAVSEVGERMARVVLTPQQVGLVSRPQRMVYLTGPPGTGKTLLLVLKGLHWLRQGHDVHVVCVFMRSLVASLMIYHQLRRTLQQDGTMPPDVGKLHFHQFDLRMEENLRHALETLTSAASDGQLYVILDETNPFAWDVKGHRKQLVEQLHATLPHLHLWTASVYHVGIPSCLDEEQLTVPLRCAPAIHRELDALLSIQTALIPLYTTSSVPSPSDGPQVIRLTHRGQGHRGQWPLQCAKCGADVAGVLHGLQVGRRGPQGKGRPPPLQHRDVFILAHNIDLLKDDVQETEIPSASDCSNFATSLRSSGFPVRIFGKEGEDTDTLIQSSRDVAVAQNDVIMLTHYDAVTGLERKVVVYVQGRPQGSLAEYIDRGCTMARCTTQLVLVEVTAAWEHDFDLD